MSLAQAAPEERTLVQRACDVADELGTALLIAHVGNRATRARYLRRATALGRELNEAIAAMCAAGGEK